MRFKEVFDRLEKSDRIVLATHLNPDADTIGSALGLYHVLRRMGKRPYLFNASPQLPYNLDFLPDIHKFGSKLPIEPDLLVSLDAGSLDRLGIEPIDVFIINIDHHRTNTYFGDINVVDPQAAATAQVVYELLRSNSVALDMNTAICLYTGLVDDTGFFRFDGVNERVFEMARDLCRHGVDPYMVAKNLTMREPLAKLRLIQELLATLELYHYATIGVVTLTQQILKRTGATKEMADDVLMMVRSLATVEVAVLLREEEDGRTKVSLRSKEVDVGAVAAEFGGGGHKNAAGFTYNGDFDSILKPLLERIKKEITIET